METETDYRAQYIDWTPKGKMKDVGWAFSQERYDKMLNHPDDDVIVAFEVPENVSKHPDVRLEMTKYNGGDVVQFAFLKGCKTCQQFLSACTCSSPVVSEKWVYDRSIGLQVGMYSRVNPAWLAVKPAKQTRKEAPTVTNPLKREELVNLAGAVDREEDGDTPAPPLSEFQDRINPLLIAHLLMVGVNLYFTYPLSKLEEIWKLFVSRERKLHIRPLSEPKPTTTTFRGGCSATIMFETPEDMSILSQYPAAMNQTRGRYIVMNDYKLALQLFFNHGFELQGPYWEDKEKADDLIAELIRKQKGGL